MVKKTKPTTRVYSDVLRLSGLETKINQGFSISSFRTLEAQRNDLGSRLLSLPAQALGGVQPRQNSSGENKKALDTEHG